MKLEMRQLHIRNTFDPRHQYDLTNKYKVEVFESHIFLKLKINGKIKRITMAGGNRQRDLITKEDVSLPAVKT